MWGKDNKSTNTLVIAQEQHRKDNLTTIGPKTIIDGTISGDADVAIHGRIKGEVVLKKNHLTIGRTGHIEGNIFAKSVLIEGVVTGIVYAHELSIYKTSNILGDIVASRITLEEGAKIKGSIDMDDQIAAEKLGALEDTSLENTVNAESPLLMPMNTAENV